MDGFFVKSFSQLWYPEIVHSGPKHKFYINLQFRRFPKSSKTITNIIIGLEWMHWWEMIFATSVPRNSTFRPKTQVSLHFTFQGFPNYPKHSQTPLLVRGIRMDAFGGK
jgi:hypothetical protein